MDSSFSLKVVTCQYAYPQMCTCCLVPSLECSSIPVSSMFGSASQNLLVEVFGLFLVHEPTSLISSFSITFSCFSAILASLVFLGFTHFFWNITFFFSPLGVRVIQRPLLISLIVHKDLISVNELLFINTKNQASFNCQLVLTCCDDYIISCAQKYFLVG